MALPVVILNSLMPGDRVFDIGSNVGDFAEQILKKGVEVVLVEPNPSIVSHLRTRFDKLTHAKIVEAGISDTEGEMELSICEEAPTLSTFDDHWKKGRFKDHKWDKRIEVKVKTLDGLIKEFGEPRLIKVDVEGHELQVIRGLKKKSGIISFEFTNEFADHAIEIIRLLIIRGYTHFNLAIGETKEFALAEWVGFYKIGQLIDSIRTNTNIWGDIYAN